MLNSLPAPVELPTDPSGETLVKLGQDACHSPIFATAALVAPNTLFSTSISLSTCFSEGETLIFAVWHGDTLTIHGAETGRCIAKRKISGIRACAPLSRSGRVCLGFRSGQLAVVSIGALIR